MKNLLVTQIVTLQKSVKKWENIVSILKDPTCKVVVERGADDCACCKEFLEGEGDPCQGCPISERTGRAGCAGTPYEYWAAAFGDLADLLSTNPRVHFHTKRERKSLLKPAKKELSFLRGVLRDKEKEARTLSAQLLRIL